MPSRIIHDKCRKSRTLNALSSDAERLFWRLTTAADDYGRFDADPRVLLSDCFPLKVEEIKAKQVETWRNELTKIVEDDELPLIRLYTMKGRTYGYFVTWTNHQRDRSKEKNPPKPKFPSPEDGVMLELVDGVPIQPVPPAMPPTTQPKMLTASQETEARFEESWKAYPDRGGKKIGKQAARLRFIKLTESEQAQYIVAVKEYAKHCRDHERTPRDAKLFIKDKDGEMWRDFIPAEKAPIRRPMSAVVQTAPPKPVLVGEDMPVEIVKRFLGKDMSMGRA